MDRSPEFPDQQPDVPTDHPRPAGEYDPTTFDLADSAYDGILAETASDQSAADIDDDALPSDAEDIAEDVTQEQAPQTVGMVVGGTATRSTVEALDLDEPESEGLPESAERTEVRWARGDVPRALGVYRDRIAETGGDVQSYIPERAKALRAAAPDLLNSDLDDAAVAERLGVTPGYVNDMRTRLLRTLDRHVPENVVPQQARLSPAERTMPGHVGEQVAQLIRATGKTPTQLARELGIPQPRMSRFTSGATRPEADEVLLPILRHLGVSDEVAEQISAQYAAEIQQRQARDT